MLSGSIPWCRDLLSICELVVQNVQGKGAGYGQQKWNGNMKAVLLSLVAGLFLLSGAQAAEPVALHVAVTGGEPGKGQMIIALFATKKDYMKNAVAEATVPVDESGAASYSFEGLAPGDLAISVIYDEDNDGKLDTGFMGIPKEKFGFSNNAKGTMGPPSFKKARFDLVGPEQQVEISLSSAR